MSEFDKQDAELISMVNQRRACYPEEPRLVLMTEAQARGLIERARRAEQAAHNRYAQAISAAFPYFATAIILAIAAIIIW